VAHPGLVSLARETFRERFRGDHQLAVTRDDIAVAAADLLALPRGVITEAGMRQNVRVGIQYLEAWLRGNGCVPLENLMEDAATAEISRAQLWQWLRHGARLEDDRLVDEVLLRRIVGDEMRRIANERGPAAFERGRFKEARDLFMELCLAKDLADFLTTPAYALLP
jgi:malate synthase